MSVIKRYTGSAWELIGGGGSSNLVAETVVSGSAVTSVTFSGLDGNAAGGYVLTGAIGKNIDAYKLNIYFNSDTTNTNYYSQEIKNTSSTTLATNQTNAPVIAEILASGGSSLFFSADIDIDINLGRLRVLGRYSRGTTTTVVNGSYSIVSVNAISTNITTITLFASSANSIAVGSTFRLYKRK